MKITKISTRWFAFGLVLLLMALPFVGFAEGEDFELFSQEHESEYNDDFDELGDFDFGDYDDYYSEDDYYYDYPPLLIDAAYLLDASEEDAVFARLAEVSDRHDFDVVVVTVDEHEGDIRTFAADVFDEGEFGRGENRDGCILLLSMEDRDFAFIAFGKGEQAFTPAGQGYLDTFFVPYLSAGEYKEAFLSFADAVDDFLIQAERGMPYDTGTIPQPSKPAESSGKRRGILSAGSVLIAFLTSFFVTGSWKGQLKSVRGESSAANYIRPGSVNVTGKKDVFLYTKRSKKPKAAPVETNAGKVKATSGKDATGHSGKF